MQVVASLKNSLVGLHVICDFNNLKLIFDTEITLSEMKKVLDLNVLGLSIFTREVVQDMRSRGVDDGHIFHINR